MPGKEITVLSLWGPITPASTVFLHVFFSASLPIFASTCQPHSTSSTWWDVIAGLWKCTRSFIATALIKNTCLISATSTELPCSFFFFATEHQQSCNKKKRRCWVPLSFFFFFVLFLSHIFYFFHCFAHFSHILTNTSLCFFFFFSSTLLSSSVSKELVWKGNQSTIPLHFHWFRSVAGKKYRAAIK